MVVLVVVTSTTSILLHGGVTSCIVTLLLYSTLTATIVKSRRGRRLLAQSSLASGRDAKNNPFSLLYCIVNAIAVKGANNEDSLKSISQAANPDDPTPSNSKIK